VKTHIEYITWVVRLERSLLGMLCHA